MEVCVRRVGREVSWFYAVSFEGESHEYRKQVIPSVERLSQVMSVRVTPRPLGVQTL